MNRAVAVVIAAVGLLASTIRPARAEVTAEQVRSAIDRGAAYLLGQQRNDGSWPDSGYYAGGVSALCTLALLNAGVKPDDERAQKALNHLRMIRPDRTYVVALQTMALAQVRLDTDRELIRQNVKWLEKTQIATGPEQGGWSYPYPWGSFETHSENGVPMIGDKSNSQFALLALDSAERAGVIVSDGTWQRAKRYWERSQYRDGSWNYSNTSHEAPSGSMTCAGIASLVIASDKVQPSDARVVGDRIECCAARAKDDADRIERAVRWLGKHYSVTRNPVTGKWTLCYLYGLERVGRLTSHRFLPLVPRPGRADRADWYREGAEHLIRTQDGLSGFWTCPPNEINPLIGTSFALLFLSKGRWPVLLGKAQYGMGDDWNLHRSDVGNLTRYVESRWKRDMTWQSVELRLAGVEDLLQTPVLYLCGPQSPLPDNAIERRELAQKIRDYLDRGGFLFAEANCGSSTFDTGFRQLMRIVFPEPEYKLQLLEREHPIWYAEEKVAPSQLRPIWGIDFGCRTSVVYVPPEREHPSFSCLWELSRPGRGNKYSQAVQSQIDAAMSVGINVLAYATNRELKYKDEIPARSVARRPGDQVERGRLYVAKLRHPGGCSAAPRALVNLMDSAGRELKLRVQARDELLDIADDALFDYHLVFVHGRTAFHLTDAERKRLKQYIERGGMLFADSICASPAFTQAFRREMAATFPGNKLERIPSSDPIFSTTYGGSDLRVVSRRDPENAAGKPLEAAVHKVPPDFEGIKFGDRWGVIFSQYDLSCALEKRDSLECRGYTRDDAARLGLNIVAYSLQQ